MPTVRENLDAGFTAPAEDAEQEAQGIRMAKSLYRVLGRGGATSFGTALALEPVIMLTIEVTGTKTTVPLGLISAVESTGPDGFRGPLALTMVNLNPGQARITVTAEQMIQLEFDPADAITEVAIFMLHAPTALVAALGEAME